MSTQEPREIAFEDIKVGDDITATLVQRGVTMTRRGVVGAIYTTGLHTAEDGYIAGSGDYTFTLNHRPTHAEPKGLGAVVRARGRTLVRTANRCRPWVDEGGFSWAWSVLDLDTIEVLSEGIEVES